MNCWSELKWECPLNAGDWWAFKLLKGIAPGYFSNNSSTNTPSLDSIALFPRVYQQRLNIQQTANLCEQNSNWWVIRWVMMIKMDLRNEQTKRSQYSGAKSLFIINWARSWTRLILWVWLVHFAALFQTNWIFEPVFSLKVPALDPDPIHYRFLLFFCGWKIWNLKLIKIIRSVI